MKSDVGAVRDRNEDAAYADPDGRFVILADGMGGHSAGDVASAMAVEIAREMLEAGAHELAAFASDPTVARRRRVRAMLDRAIQLANEAISLRARREPDKRGMGTTLELVVLAGDEILVAHVGDSRTYLLRDGALTQLTFDHTVAETMRRAGTWTDEEADASPMRSALSSAVGVMDDPMIDHVGVPLEPGDRVLVCSDGLYDYFKADELGALLAGDDPDAALTALIAEARARGGHDNITGVIVDVDPDGAPDALDDEPTTPINVPLEPAGPLNGMGEKTMTDLLDRVLGPTTELTN
ncbi:MAG TPA: protein phosphatase 2C domain-containing protein [Kofleriaceae bacterium]|nr:protein phosphatase 2C domain-containing protein [Kofleriaceae bacterium]